MKRLTLSSVFVLSFVIVSAANALPAARKSARGSTVSQASAAIGGSSCELLPIDPIEIGGSILELTGYGSPCHAHFNITCTDATGNVCAEFPNDQINTGSCMGDVRAAAQKIRDGWCTVNSVNLNGVNLPPWEYS